MTENLTGTELVADGLIKRYGKREVLKGVSLNAKPGEIVGLLGPNGAGKTTTFSILAGFTLPDAGSLRLGEMDLTRLPPHKRAKNGLVYLPQESSVFTKLSVEDNIRAITQTLGLPKSDQDRMVHERLEELNLIHLAKQKAGTLSGGERRRLEITRALVLKPSVLLLDEPFSGVDPISVSEVRNIIVKLSQNGMGILLTDHNVRETLRAVDRAYLLYDGKILVHGDADFLQNDSIAREKYLGFDFKV